MAVTLCARLLVSSRAMETYLEFYYCSTNLMTAYISHPHRTIGEQGGQCGRVYNASVVLVYLYQRYETVRRSRRRFFVVVRRILLVVAPLLRYILPNPSREGRDFGPLDFGNLWSRRCGLAKARPPPRSCCSRQNRHFNTRPGVRFVVGARGGQTKEVLSGWRREALSGWTREKFVSLS